MGHAFNYSLVPKGRETVVQHNGTFEKAVRASIPSMEESGNRFSRLPSPNHMTVSRMSQENVASKKQYRKHNNQQALRDFTAIDSRAFQTTTKTRPQHNTTSNLSPATNTTTEEVNGTTSRSKMVERSTDSSTTNCSNLQEMRRLVQTVSNSKPKNVLWTMRRTTDTGLHSLRHSKAGFAMKVRMKLQNTDNIEVYEHMERVTFSDGEVYLLFGAPKSPWDRGHRAHNVDFIEVSR